MTISCWVDGACRPNPGKGGIGIVIQGEGYDYSISKRVVGSRVSNNEAEYGAVRVALTELILNELTNREITIHSDSELLVRQLNGECGTNRGSYLTQYRIVSGLLKRFSNLSVVWIPREENSEANLLASQALKGG